MKRESDTKTRLLEVAVALIWEQSYGSVGVDDICKKAGVTKGSFYFAFPSKSDLAVAAFEAHWQHKKLILDQVFSSQSSALEQFDGYCDIIVKDQLEKYRTYGKMCGCPFCSVGSELSTQDEKVRLKANQILERFFKYLSGAVRSAQDDGLIKGKNHEEIAHDVCDFVTGLLIQAKIENSPEHLKRLKPGVFRILGLSVPEAVPA
jgi:TetR/AcrR family transcriptional repressor of nem operon